MRAPFVVLEGLDCSGKTTQMTRCVEYFKTHGIPHTALRFPDRTTAIGKIINDYLQNTTELDDRKIHELFSKNRWEFADQIRNDLEAGKIVICDRYAYSGVAYSAAKGLDLDWCKGPDAGLPEPDLVIFLQVSPEVARQRKSYGQERYENEEFQRRVKAVYQKLIHSSAKFTIVDADQTLDHVHNQLLSLITSVQHQISDHPIDPLWIDSFSKSPDFGCIAEVNSMEGLKR